MTSVKSFVSLNRPWAYIFWSVHEFVIALNFHVLYWRSPHCSTAYNAAFLLILTFLKLIRLIVPSFIWFIYSCHSLTRLFVQFVQAVADPVGGTDTPPLPPPPIRPDAVWDWNSYIHRIVYHFLSGWFFLRKRALHFATKLKSWDIQKCDCLRVTSYDLFASARKDGISRVNGDRCLQIEKYIVGPVI